MAVPLTVPPLGPEGAARLAEWYQPEGTLVAPGDLVYCLETDFAAIEVEAESAGTVRQAVKAGAIVPSGDVVAEIVPPEEQPRRKRSEAAADPGIPPQRSPRRKQGSYPLAAVLAPPDETTDPGEDEALAGLPWDAFPVEASPAEEHEEHKPLLLFPRIVSAIKEEEEAIEEAEEEPVPEQPADVEETPPARGASAWELVPGETDFNPDWLLEPSRESRARDQAEAEARDRFQASKIRSLALGREASAEPAPEAPPAEAPAPVETPPDEQPGEAATPPPPDRLLDLEDLEERRGDYSPGPTLFARITVNVTEAVKMRDQLTREWMGGNVRPLTEDIVLRAIARALLESSAFRRRTDVVGIRPLNGNSRGLHLLANAATRPFRDAVASLAALRETPGGEAQCTCTLTNYGDLGIDDAMPGLPAGQPLAFGMGAVREVARFTGDRPQRVSVLTLSLSYDSDAMPEGAAARLLSRVCELVEGPYALLAE